MAFVCLAAVAPARAQVAPTPQPPLPAPSGRPMTIDFAADPVLRLRRQQAGYEPFRTIIAAAVERHPGTAESAANEDEALAQLEEARAAGLPTVDLNVTSYRVLSRDFSNDPFNIIERSRPRQRTDAILSVQQVLFDFGATARRITAAGARLRAAGADLEVAADRVALGAVAAWYDVFAYRALVMLTDAFVASQRDLRGAVEIRIREGVSAEGDLARVDSYIAQAQTRLARFRRLLANAEARFTELTGSPPPAIERAPIPGAAVASREEAVAAAEDSAAVRSASAQSDAARDEARAARSDRLPQIAAGVDAGRYGVIENDRDYDVRARIALRYRIFGAADARAEQGEARARAADARASRIREEAGRDAAIAWSDVRALEEQLEAIETAYIASRRSRDVILERFRVARGTLFDVVAAEDAYFESATSYIQALTELDAARYVLLSRMGRLLDTLRIEADALRGEG
ncbi:MAG: outer membrane protein adhesin transport system [Sphingomonadales bacterium]|jgi:adhesin transport system outer membrane protein|nr:outer membrane protein adhesin transport system [Sphingomonadales bacterium]